MMSGVDPSEKWPVAVKLPEVDKLSTERLADVTVIDCSTGSVTVSSVLPLTPTKVALIVEVPTERAWANPLLAATLLTVATPIALEAQSASKVRSWVVESENLPLTANWVFKPLLIVGAAGVIVMAVTVAELTVKLKVADTLPTVAVRMAVPGPMPDTLLGIAVIANPATVGEALDQTA